MELSGPGVQYIADNQLVRRKAVTTYKYYFLNIITAPKLGERESLELNTASLQKIDICFRAKSKALDIF